LLKNREYSFPLHSSFASHRCVRQQQRNEIMKYFSLTVNSFTLSLRFFFSASAFCCAGTNRIAWPDFGLLTVRAAFFFTFTFSRFQREPNYSKTFLHSQ
jgi:hypothetical protein